MVINHPADKKVELPETWLARWKGPDGGLICAYARGREKGAQEPKLKEAALSGELPPLAWAGGVAGPLKIRKKYGSLLYLATWQGIRGDALLINTETQNSHTCSRYGVTVIFTLDASHITREE